MDERTPATVVKDSQIVDNSDFRTLSNHALLARITALAAAESAASAALVECMAVVDERRLWADLGYSSMFTFCAYGLRLGEAPAYKRIRAARAIRIFPPISSLLRDGRLSLEAVAMLHPHLESPEIAGLVTKACGLWIKALESLLANLRSAEPARDVVRYIGMGIPSPRPPECNPEAEGLSALPFFSSPEKPTESPRTESNSTANATANSAPDPAKLIRVSFTADEDFYRLLEKARSTLRHKYPAGQIAGVLREALTLLVEKRDPVFRWRNRREKRKDQNMS